MRVPWLRSSVSHTMVCQNMVPPKMVARVCCEIMTGTVSTFRGRNCPQGPCFSLTASNFSVRLYSRSRWIMVSSLYIHTPRRLCSHIGDTLLTSPLFLFQGFGYVVRCSPFAIRFCTAPSFLTPSICSPHNCRKRSHRWRFLPRGIGDCV